MAVQAGHGYYRFEVDRYAVGLFVVQGWPMYLLAVLAIAIQTIASNKFFGMLLLVVLFLGVGAMNALGFEHVLYQFGVPTGPLSDMNGWGHYVEPMLTVGAYWSLWMVLAGVVAHLFMRRGAIAGVSERLAVARLRLTRPVVVTSIATAVAIAMLGSWIFYNTNVLNRYETARDTERLQAQYEQRYRQ